MHGLILDLEQDYKKAGVVAVRSGDTVRVTQRVKEANRERLQIFEGLVIRVDRANSLSYRVTVRKLTSGVWVEKSFLVHSPNVVKIEVVKRAKVRRNYLSYMRDRVGKAARLKGAGFDAAEVNRFAQAQTPLELVEAAADAKAEEADEEEPLDEAKAEESDEEVRAEEDDAEESSEEVKAEESDEDEKPADEPMAEETDEDEESVDEAKAETDDEDEKPSNGEEA